MSGDLARFSLDMTPGPSVMSSVLQRFDFQKFVEAEFAEFASDAGLLEPAERRRGVEPAAIDFYLAGANAPCDARCALRVA